MLLITGVVLTWIATPSTMAQVPPIPIQRPQQQSQSPVRQIEAEAATQIEALLSSSQQNQYRTARRRGAGLVQALDAVENISEDQQSEINKITRRTSRRIMDLVRPAPRR